MSSAAPIHRAGVATGPTEIVLLKELRLLNDLPRIAEELRAVHSQCHAAG